MANPQQPELRRSNRGATTDDSAKNQAESTLPADDGKLGGRVPPGNRPGHHPDHEASQPDLDDFAERLGLRSDDDSAG